MNIDGNHIPMSGDDDESHGQWQWLVNAVEAYILIWLIAEFIKGAIRHPVAFLVFIGSTTGLAVWCEHLQHFNPWTWIPLTLAVLSYMRLFAP